MCGFVGFWGSDKTDTATVEHMAKQLFSRGPDDSGLWTDPSAGLALAHRRLAILDLSSAGHQPMHSTCGRYVLIYNGEIYNHQQLRADLASENIHINWRGHSDTETLLAALSHWSLEKCLKRLNGMFAFALWDQKKHTLSLARDRIGEKPLYYGTNNGIFFFGSELKALRAHPDWRSDINRNALALYMRHNYIPTPWSIYTGISKLPPAHYTIIQKHGHNILPPTCYWDLSQIAQASDRQYKQTHPEDLTDELDTLLRHSIKSRMASDVPLGAFLSGGFDSTTVAALMQAQSTRPVKTFSIGFHEAAYNEAQHAKAVAQHLGTEHTELYVTPEQAMAIIPKIPEIYDEPFADSSQIPTFLVSQLAREHVIVSLSGDGGDELFCGYNRYLLSYRIWQKIRLMPLPIRKSLAWLLNHAPAHTIDRMQQLLPPRFRVSALIDRLPKLASTLLHQDESALYLDLISHHKTPESLVLGSEEPKTHLNGLSSPEEFSDFRENMMYLDMMTYLPDDILTKVDRASMAVSLEARVPLLDHNLIEFAWRVPLTYKYRNNKSKWLLRRVLDRYVPRSLMERPKMGFGVPIDDWLRGPLRDWAEQLLNEHKLQHDGFFAPKPIRTMWKEHISGQRRWHYHLWDVLMFQAWYEQEKCI